MQSLTVQPSDDEDKIEDESNPGGEAFAIDEETSVIENDDGSAIVKLDEDAPLSGDDEFYGNLAESLPDDVVSAIAVELDRLIEIDAKAREKRDEQYEEGLRRTGLGEDAPGGAAFQGASKVVHPVLVEACVDFEARVIKELFPPGGPVKAHTIGDQPPTADTLKKAKRKAAFMNWQLRKQMPGFRAELEQLLTQVPMGGAQYLKLKWDDGKKRPVPLFVAIDDVFLPFAATSFYTAERKTHRQYYTKAAFDREVGNGTFVDIGVIRETIEPETSLAEKANDKIEGREASGYNEDGLRVVYECACTWEIEGDDEADGPAPYLITLDGPTKRIVAIYRNWRADDDTQDEMQHIVEFPFVPWRGAYPIGFPQMIGGLSGAATGALRALLDSAHINNFPGALKLKGGAGGQNINLNPTEVQDIEGAFTQDDIRKTVMPIPFNPPSPVLFQLMGMMVDAAKGVVRTTLDDIADINPNAPVGTTLAHIEQGLVVFSSIHARLHEAMGRVLDVLHRINEMYLDDEEIERQTGTKMARRSDFAGPMDVEPVSDPNIFSETQRFAQIQAVQQRAALMPQLYNLRKVEEMFLERTKLPGAKDLLNPEPTPIDTNAANENVAAVMGRPITAFPMQDHLAHLQAHLDFAKSPVLGMNPLIAPKFLPGILNHIKEHVALWYVVTMYNHGSDAVGIPLDEIQRLKDKDAHAKLDQTLAAFSPDLVQMAEQTFAGMMPVIQQLMQAAQQMAPPMPTPVDPGQAAMAEVERKKAADQTKAQADQQQAQVEMMREQRAAAEQARKIQTDERRLALDAQQAAMREQGETARNEADISARVGMNTMDNETALTIANMEVESGERIGVSTGTGINP
jgi:hypothetical protein